MPEEWQRRYAYQGGIKALRASKRLSQIEDTL